MALIPLNAFKNITTKLTDSPQLIYETPLTISTIILSATCANYSSNIVSMTMKMERIMMVMGVPTAVEFFIVPDIEIPPKDVLSAIAGRLVLEQGDKLYAFASVDTAVDMILSINEAANE